MILLRVILLWGLVSLHIVGAAFLFRRLFPRESRWLAFLVPEIIVVLACNFVEHHVALTALRFVLPVTTLGSVVVLAGPRAPWRTMRLPTALFLGAFAFALTVRALRPDLESSTDAVYDAGIMAHFMYGQALPVEGVWLSSIKLLYYYCLPHYAGSVLIRLLGVDLGTGYNLCAGLLSAYLYFMAGAVAWHLGRGQLWLAIAAAALTACASTGSAGYLWLTVKDLAPANITNLNSLVDRPTARDNALLSHLVPLGPNQSCVLFPPGIGSWTGHFHSMNAGQGVLAFGLLAFIELVRRKKTNWPWISLALFPFLLLTTCTWGMPLAGFILAAAVVICAWTGLVPESPRFVLAAAIGLAVLLEPMLAYFLSTPTLPVDWVPTAQHTQVLEFLVQWWPVFLPWLALGLIWKRLSPVTRTVLVMTPLAFLGAEFLTIGWRSDMTGKFWALIFAAAWLVFLPELARQKAWPFRALFGLIVLNSLLTFCFWTTYYARIIDRREIGHLEGLGQFRFDPTKARLLEILSHLDNQIVIPGQDQIDITPNELLIELTHNRSYATWEVLSDCVFYPNGMAEAGRRFPLVHALYDGTLKNPLYYLRQRNIAALVIYPDDNIDPAIVEQLKKDLAPYYTFDDADYRSAEDIRQDVLTKNPCAGVFLYHPEIGALLGPPPPDDGKK